MKKSLALLLLIIFLSTSACLSLGADADNDDEQKTATIQGWPWYPYRRPYFPRPHIDQKTKECIKSYQAGRRCIQEIYVSFWVQHLSIGNECCKLVKEVGKDCGDTIFARFKNPFFQLLVKEHCDHKACLATRNGSNGGAPSPAPSPKEEDSLFD